MSNPTSPTDPLALVESLDANALRERLAELDKQRDALRLLLRAAARRDKRANQAVCDVDREGYARGGAA